MGQFHQAHLVFGDEGEGLPFLLATVLLLLNEAVVHHLLLNKLREVLQPVGHAATLVHINLNIADLPLFGVDIRRHSPVELPSTPFAPKTGVNYDFHLLEQHLLELVYLPCSALGKDYYRI
jgi:hypothetical protein